MIISLIISKIVLEHVMSITLKQKSKNKLFLSFDSFDSLNIQNILVTAMEMETAIRRLMSANATKETKMRTV